MTDNTNIQSDPEEEERKRKQREQHFFELKLKALKDFQELSDEEREKLLKPLREAVERAQQQLSNAIANMVNNIKINLPPVDVDTLDTPEELEIIAAPYKRAILTLQETANIINEQSTIESKIYPYFLQELEKIEDDFPGIEELDFYDFRFWLDESDEDILSFLARTEAIKNSDTIESAFNELEETAEPPLKYLRQIIKAIRAAKEKFKEEHPEETAAVNLPKIKSALLSEIKYPLAKPNTELFDLFPLKEIIPLKAESDIDAAKGKKANIYMLLEFEELDGFKISRTLNIYDKYVFIAVSNLIEQGHEYVTAAQIYKAMGYKGKPGQADKQKIIDSINVMSMARVMIDTTNENAETKYKYDSFKQTFNLLNTEIVQGMFKGNVIHETIHIKEMPKLFTFAANRKQITSIPQALLSVPISNSDQNLKLKDYLIRRIARMKSAKSAPKTIKIDTLCSACDITDKKAKQRLTDKLNKLLGYFKEQEYIKEFIINADRIEIKI